MTVISMSQAMQEIEAKFRAVWSPRKCDYPGSDFDIKTDVTKDDTWARYTIQHVTGNQASLANVIGKKRFDRGGTIIIQVFTPLNNGVLIAYDAAEIVVGAYEGKSTPSGAWFRNVRINEVDNNDLWQQVNVLIDFTYDQIH